MSEDATSQADSIPSSASAALSSGSTGAKRGGLKRQLLRSHLSIAGMGLVLLVVALGASFWLREHALELATNTAPSMEKLLRIHGGIQQSLAALRGWTALGERSLLVEWDDAWNEVIHPSVTELVQQDQEWAESEYVQDLKGLLLDLQEAQWYIMDVAQAPGNIPSQDYFNREIGPVVETLEQTIESILVIQQGRRVASSFPGQKSLESQGLEFLAMLKGSHLGLQSFIFMGQSKDEQVFHVFMDKTLIKFADMVEHSEELKANEQDLMVWLTDQFKRYQQLATRSITLRKDADWNVSQFLISTQTLPLVSQIESTLVILTAREQLRMDENVAQVQLISTVALWLGLFLFGGMALVAVMISRRSAERLAAPIGKLTAAAKDLAAGKTKQAIPVTSDDELGQLSASFNNMLQALNSREESLVDAMILTQGIVDTAADSIITIDEIGRIESFNKTARDMFGYSEGEVLGQNVSMLMPSPYHEEHDGYLEQYRQTGEKRIIGIGREVVGLRKDGTIFPIDLSVSEVQMGSRRVFTGIVRDISTRKEAESELVKARDQAVEAVRMKSEFLAMMSHEIRTPMNGVLGMTGILLESELDKDQRECAETVKHSADALLTIINDILDFSKIESGKLDIEVIDFDLRVAVEEVLDLVGAKAQEKGLELVGLVYASVPTAVRGDPGRFRQILLNLVGNAIKFTAQGEVVIQVVPETETDQDLLLRVEVADTGIGLTPEAQGRLFQPFTQADGSTTRKFGGTGLGLSISKQLAELMQGNIGVVSEPGHGSRFWFTVRLEKQPTSVERQELTSKSLKGHRVCVVDDNDTNRLLMHHYTSAWDMTCLSAESGLVALTLMKDAVEQGNPCDLLLLDMQMPEMDGLELASRVKADPTLAAVKIVMVTSIGRRGDAAAAREAGISAYLTKPIHQGQLRDCLWLVMSGGTEGDDQFVTQYTIQEAKHQLDARLLLADDNMVNQKVGVRMLEKLGYRVDVVANGAEAVDAVSRIAYDAVLMDGQMPEMDGYEATQTIRIREAAGEHFGRGSHSFHVDSISIMRIPIIAMTANAMQGDREHCLAVGMDDFVSKPVNVEALKGVLERWVRKKETSLVASDSSFEKNQIPDTNDQQPAARVEQQDSPLDVATLDGLRDLAGDDLSFLSEVIQQFLHDGPKHVAAIRHAVEQTDADALMKAAHALKGSCRNMGALPLGELCFVLEQKGRAGESGNLQDLLSAVDQEYSRVQTALEAELEHLTPSST